MSAKPTSQLSRREQEIMDIVHRLGAATAVDIRAQMSTELSDSSVRTFLRRLEEKAMLKHRTQAGQFLYQPLISKHKASRTAMRRVLDTFFSGSLSTAVAALVDVTGDKISPEEIARVEEIIRQSKAKRAGKPAAK
jgi:predicted transcriptional regulator